MVPLLSKTEDFLLQCTACGICTEACPFLTHYGNPYDIVKNRSTIVFLCTNCKACDTFCPSELSPSDALLALKHSLVKSNSLPDSIKNVLSSGLSFVMRGHRFPFSYYQSTDTAFWPGCSLQGSSPELVRKTLKILSQQLNKKVGLVLDCCFDPLYHNGDLDSVKAAFERIKERLEKHGIKRLILGCTNCKKIFSLYMPEIKSDHILEVFTDTKSKPVHFMNIKDVYLHHPCPSFRFNPIREKALSHIESFATVVTQQSRPMCCGLGGASHTLSEEISDRFAEKVIENADGHPIVTYCMGCKNKYLKKGSDAYHILEFITDTKPSKQPVSSGRKWINRLFLATEQRLKSKRFLLAIAVIMAIIIATYLRKLGYISPEALFDFIKQNRVLAPALFILIYTIGPSLFIPSLPLTLGAGFLWGPFWGVVFSITGATLGASVPFFLSRYVLGETIKQRFSYAKWQWLQERVNKHGWKAVAFTRIVPIFPYPVLNYLFGVTPIPFVHYLWSTFTFMLPACIAYTAFGSSMGELILKGNIKGLIIGILIATVALLIPFIFKGFYKKIMSIKDEK